tara:strand:+ start:1513 stop:1905 length:393 start_codon:yes stop_codon:yes gene_type:complete
MNNYDKENIDDSRIITMFCPSCGSPTMEIESLALCRAPISFRDTGGQGTVVIDWGNGYPMGSDEDAIGEVIIGCSSCDEPVLPPDDELIVLDSSPQAIMWDKHPGWTKDGWADGVTTIRSLQIERGENNE